MSHWHENVVIAQFQSHDENGEFTETTYRCTKCGEQSTARLYEKCEEDKDIDEE